MMPLRSRSVLLTWLGVTLTAAATLVIDGCGKKPEVKNTTTTLEQAFAESNAPAPNVQATAAAEPAISAGEHVKAALQAVRQDDFAASVVQLENAAQASGTTPQQLMAVEQAKQAIITDLVNRAARGDQKAKDALAAIEKSRSQ
jgi:hypothetical protein